ncbi:MAG TPA: nucleotidyltransferase domain-containing protein [Planctomycetota bacterium]|mgnify:CR=1 FL=1|jgi:predicted nucleotidyltransferase|nr:nucleotidyltransferase domain-containing protein [Planctomycetota bacterium]
MADGLKRKYRQMILDILSANERVESAVLFGSRAMGTFTPQSDVDIALFGKDLTLNDLASLIRQMEESIIPHKVDLLLHDDITAPKLKEHIRQHGVEWWRRREGLESPGSWVERD